LEKNASILTPAMLNSLHYVKYRLGIASALTQTTGLERECLGRHAKGKQRLVEIGVFHGVNTRAFRQVMHPDGVMIAVDPFPRSFFGIRGFGWARRIAHREVGQINNGQVLWIERLGKDVPATDEIEPFLPVDFIFIDGDHSYDGLCGDWMAWKDHIAGDGIVALHDSRCRQGWGSEKFTREVILQDPHFELREEVDSLTVLRRKA
jgi:hypothetical protein